MTQLRTKRIYDAPAPEDGTRLLVMRLWPRGVRKDQVDAWDKGLAPSRELLGDLNSGAIEWNEYTRRFRWEMADRPDSIESVRSLRQRVTAETVTLLCWCRDESRCHRSLLRDMILETESATP